MLFKACVLAYVCMCVRACCVLRVYTGVAERGKQTSPRSNECSLGSSGIPVPIKQRTKMLSSHSHHSGLVPITGVHRHTEGLPSARGGKGRPLQAIIPRHQP